MKTCLLVIDAQQSFTRRPFFSPADVPAYLAAQNALIEGAKELGLPIVRIFHVNAEADAQDPFHPASGLVRPLEGLADFSETACFHKSRHSALVGTGLDVWLTRHDVSRIIVSGIRTEQCCETTTRHASDLGWQVDFVPSATLTWDMMQPNGRVLAAADIKLRTATVLQTRFAQMCSVDEALARATSRISKQ